MATEEPTGESKVSGSERLDPGFRQRTVARAYIDGLERDRRELHLRERELNSTIFEAVQLGAYNRAAYQALLQLRLGVETGNISEELIDRVDVLLEDGQAVRSKIYECECGHSKYDHDEHGCVFLGCRPICGVDHKGGRK